jgi:glycerol-3-phosphate acyltransferase PlsY
MPSTTVILAGVGVSASDLGGCAFGYLAGSLPFGLWLGRSMRGLDVRDFGSHSMGSTNVLRTVGPAAAAGVLALDVAKGSAAVLVARALGAGPGGQAAAGLAAAAGHSWPVLARFRGGKSVAVAFGSLLVLSPLGSAFAFVGGMSALLGTRIVSVGSLAAAGSATAGTAVVWARGNSGPAPFAFAAGVTALIVARHTANLRRLSRGEEPRVDLARLRSAGGPPATGTAA